MRYDPIRDAEQRAAYWAATQPLLQGMLTLAIPKCLDELDVLAGEVRQEMVRAWREDAGPAVEERGDVILFRSKKRGESAKAFAALARGLAVLALNPGGVEFLGQVWCAAHSRFGQTGGPYPCGQCLANEQGAA
jgi:hypothetical protein